MICYPKSSSCYSILMVLLLEMNLFLSLCRGTKVFYVHWNTTNPIFRIDNTDHIIDVNKGNIPFEYDQVNIMCPVYTQGTNEEDAEKYIIYNVSKEEYDTCRITNPNPRIIAVCDKPYKLMYFTITFRSFTPQPGGLEFRPGQDYYFISTSSKEDLHRRLGGRCSTHNMKVVFKVCCHNDNSINNRSNVMSHNPAQMPVTHKSTTTSSTSTIATTRPTTSRTTPAVPSRVPAYKDYEVPAYNVKATTKKSKEYEKHPNEVLKNEELTYNTSSRAVSIQRTLLCAVAVTTILVSCALSRHLLSDR